MSMTFEEFLEQTHPFEAGVERFVWVFKVYDEYGDCGFDVFHVAADGSVIWFETGIDSIRDLQGVILHYCDTHNVDPQIFLDSIAPPTFKVEDAVWSDEDAD